jgi:integrase/recombinase XerD
MANDLASLREWLRENSGNIVFPDNRGEPLSSFAVRFLLKKAVTAAEPRCASLKKKRISPHTVRHGTDMALLDAGVDISVIALWLGHQSLLSRIVINPSAKSMSLFASRTASPLRIPVVASNPIKW